MRLMRILAVALLLVTSSLLAAPPTLTFGVVESPVIFDGFVKELNTSANYKVALKVFPNFDELYKAFNANQVDIAYLGAVKYVEAHQELVAIPIVSDGTVQSFIFVKKDSPIKTVAELKGKSFAFGYEDSTS